MTTSTLRDAEVQQFLRFRLADGTLAMVRSHHLTEVLNLELKQVISIPDVQPALVGVYNWRGEVLWLLDLGLYLGSEPLYQKTFNTGKVSIVIVHFEGQTLGLCVKQVDEMVGCPIREIQSPPKADLSQKLKACLDGYWLDSNQAITWVLGAQKLIESLD